MAKLDELVAASLGARPLVSELKPDTRSVAPDDATRLHPIVREQQVKVFWQGEVGVHRDARAGSRHVKHRAIKARNALVDNDGGDQIYAFAAHHSAFLHAA